MRLRALALVLGLGLLAACVPKPPAGTPLPDLIMGSIDRLTVSNPAGGTHALRFDTTVINIGATDFRLRASRESTSAPWKVQQVLPNTSGGTTAYDTTAGYIFGGDGHFHWHVRDLATYRLYSLPDLALVGQAFKSGFCFFDTTPHDLGLPGAPQWPIYDSVGCGEQPSTVSTMGLSIGWGDTYPKELPGQEIDVTGLAAGDYRLQVTADEDKKYFESTRDNNHAWTDFRLSYLSDGRARITILGEGSS
jgi:hypothetical protein